MLIFLVAQPLFWTPNSLQYLAYCPSSKLSCHQLIIRILVLHLPSTLSTSHPTFRQVSQYLIPTIGNSDHLSILATLNLKSRPSSVHSSSYKKVWLFHQADFNSINDSLASMDWSSILSQDVDVACSAFTEIFLTTVKKFTPVKSIPTQLPGWLPRALLAKIKRRRASYFKAISTNSPFHWAEYKKLRNSITNEIRNSKADFVNSLSKSPRQFWTYVRSLRRSNDPIPPLKPTNSTMIATLNVDKANSLNEAFADVFIKDQPPSALPTLQPSSVCSENLLCSRASILDLISTLPIHTSCGQDGITSLLLRATAYSISIPLQHIFNLSISTGRFPTSWKNSIVVPLPKTSPASSNPTNYRPISLLNLPSKLLLNYLNDMYSISWLNIFTILTSSLILNLDFYLTAPLRLPSYQ